MADLKNIRREMKSAWTADEKAALKRKYRGLWDDAAREELMRAAEAAGIGDKYAACADEFLYGRNDWKGFVACLESAAKQAGLKDTYRNLYH